MIDNPAGLAIAILNKVREDQLALEVSIDIAIEQAFAAALARHCDAPYEEVETRLWDLDFDYFPPLETPAGWVELAELIMLPGSEPLPVAIH